MNHIDIIQYREIVEAFENAGYDVRDYSGRGMYGYGKKCLGVTCDNPMVAYKEMIQEYDSTNESDTISDFLDMLGDPQTDSMGMSSILYFPDLEWQELDESEDEEENEE